MSKLGIIDLNLEQAYDEAARLGDCEILYADKSTVYRGNHPEHGLIYIVIPLAGDSMILPIVIQGFTL